MRSVRPRAGCAALAATLLALAGAHVAVAGSPPGTPAPEAVAPAAAPFAVGLRVERLLDRSRRIRLGGGRTEPRPLLTYVRYPALGPAGGEDVHDPAPAPGGPYPLIVFGHGFDVTPAIYSRLLRAWAGAGFVVAAPVFPLAAPDAPGGPTEADLVNQPRDMSFVISALERESRTPGSPLAGAVDPARIAVAGQSDGAITAFAAAYDDRLRDTRVRAAVILAGADLFGADGENPPGSPPLLVAQGTADPINAPVFGERVYRRARRPKFLLRLLGAGHLPPYTYEQPQLGIVERVSVAFLRRYLEQRGTPGGLQALADVRGVASLASSP